MVLVHGIDNPSQVHDGVSFEGIFHAELSVLSLHIGLIEGVHRIRVVVHEGVMAERPFARHIPGADQRAAIHAGVQVPGHKEHATYFEMRSLQAGYLHAFGVIHV